MYTYLHFLSAYLHIYIFLTHSYLHFPLAYIYNFPDSICILGVSLAYFLKLSQLWSTFVFPPPDGASILVRIGKDETWLYVDSLISYSFNYCAKLIFCS